MEDRGGVRLFWTRAGPTIQSEGWGEFEPDLQRERYGPLVDSIFIVEWRW